MAKWEKSKYKNEDWLLEMWYFGESQGSNLDPESKQIDIVAITKGKNKGQCEVVAWYIQWGLSKYKKRFASKTSAENFAQKLMKEKDWSRANIRTFFK